MEEQVEEVEVEVEVEEVEVDLTKLRNDKCNPIAAQIIQMIGKADINIEADGSERSGGHEALYETYKPVCEDILKLFLEKDLTIADTAYILSVTDVVFSTIKRFVNESTEKNFNDAEDVLWGKSVSDITFSEIHKVLTK